jgi:hypothetical protein
MERKTHLTCQQMDVDSSRGRQQQRYQELLGVPLGWQVASALDCSPLLLTISGTAVYSKGGKDVQLGLFLVAWYCRIQ